MKVSKDCIIQVRCTKEEKQCLDKLISNSKMKRSDFIREKLFGKSQPNRSSVIFTTKAQEFLNCAKKLCGTDRELERQVDDLWNILNL